MSEVVVSTTEKKKKKEKAEEIAKVIERVKKILQSLHLSTFYKYREAGLAVLESGYERGKWHSKHCKEALEEWAISQPTFYIMLALGRLSDQEFSNAVIKFPSVHAWTNRPREASETTFPPLPEGKFRTIIVDPPWPMLKILREERMLQEEELGYKGTLTLDQIKNDVGEKVKEKAADGCHVYLWATHKYLPVALEVFKAWDVEYECLLTWVKNVGFTPYSWMYSTEHILFGRIGSLEILEKGHRLDFSGKVREHSRKPDEFYELVKKVSPEPRIDMFSREKRDGFEQWGNESGKF